MATGHSVMTTLPTGGLKWSSQRASCQSASRKGVSGAAVTDGRRGRFHKPSSGKGRALKSLPSAPSPVAETPGGISEPGARNCCSSDETYVTYPETPRPDHVSLPTATCLQEAAVLSLIYSSSPHATQPAPRVRGPLTNAPSSTWQAPTQENRRR